MYDYVARMYDPITGHFISADTVFDGWDRYAYVMNNPMRFSDPSGHLTEEQIREWTGYDKDDLSPEFWDMLLNLRFGDVVYGFNQDSEDITALGGIVWLDSETGQLRFGTSSIHDILNENYSDYIISRLDNNGDPFVAYNSANDKEYGQKYSDFVSTNQNKLWAGDSVDREVTIFDQFSSIVGQFFIGLGFGIIGDAIGCGSFCSVTGGGIGFYLSLRDLCMADRVLTYFDSDGNGKTYMTVFVMYEETILKHSYMGETPDDAWSQWKYFQLQQDR